MILNPDPKQYQLQGFGITCITDQLETKRPQSKPTPNPDAKDKGMLKMLTDLQKLPS